MRTIKLIAAVLAAIALSACSTDNNGIDKLTSEIDAYPVVIEGQQRWSLMGTDGTILLSDTFETAPSIVIDGVFGVMLDDGFAAVRIAGDGSLTTIAHGLRYVGAMHEGRMPVCRADSAIEVIDSSGTTLFSLGASDGRSYSACAPYYSCGLLTVRDSATGLWGAVDRDGHTVVEPQYFYLSTFNDGHAIGIRKDNIAVVDTKGNATDLDPDFHTVTGSFIDGHSIVQRASDGRRCVIDTKGRVAEFSAGIVALLLCREGSVFIDSRGLLGVIGYNGEVAIVPARRALLTGIAGSDRLLVSDGTVYTVVDATGREKGTFPAGTHGVEWLYGARGFLADRGSAAAPLYSFFDADCRPAGNLRFSRFERRLALSDPLLSDLDSDHSSFNTADPGDELPDWMTPDTEDDDEPSTNEQ